MKKRAVAEVFEISPQTEPEQGDLFVCEIANWPIKDDIASMELPLFSLAKNKDLNTREYKRGNKTIRIIPSSVGSATVFDKDLLIYISSQIVAALNSSMPVSRTIKIQSLDFLNATERGDGRRSFEAIMDMLRRLRGTTIETNIPTGGKRQTEGFSLIDSYKVLSEKKRTVVKDGEEAEVSRVLEFTVTISEWLYNGLMQYEVLTMDQRYFKLTSSTDRRLYEIARKHCGDQPLWKINIDLLGEKIGKDVGRFKMRDIIRSAIERDILPEYRIALDTAPTPDDVVFYTRDNAKLAKELIRIKGSEWYSALERTDNPRQKNGSEDQG